jgi:type IV pilus assembly protein PilN
MRISLNLATRPFTDLGPAIRRLRIAMGVLAVLSILFGIGLHFFDRRAAEARARERVVDAQIARVEAERQRAEDLMHQPANAEVLDQSVALNQIFDDKTFSWTLAMEAMETVLPSGVQVSAIEPVREKDGHIVVHLRVVGGHDRAVELVRNLERSRRFLLPRIVNETSESSSTPNKTPEPASPSNRFTFDLLADYNPPTPEERAALHMAAKPTAPKRPTPVASQSIPLGMRPPHPGEIPGSGQRSDRKPYAGPAPAQNGGAAPYFNNPSRTANPAPGGPQ